MLFEFETVREAERVLARGRRRVQENFLRLEKWNPEVGCFWKDCHAREVRVRVMGLPLHLWRREVFKKIDDSCGVFIKEDKDTASMSELQWARILVKLDGRSLPSSTPIVGGSECFSVLLWWEFPPWFVQVPLQRNSVDDLIEDGEEEDGCLCTTCSKSPKDRFAQKEEQCWVQDVSYSGGTLKGGAAFANVHSIGVQAEATTEAREEGSIGRNGLTVGWDVSCSSLSDVMRSGVEAVSNGAGGEESGLGGLGGLECLGPQSLNGSCPLKRKGREAKAVRLVVRGVGRKRKVGVAFGPSEVGFVGRSLF